MSGTRTDLINLLYSQVESDPFSKFNDLDKLKKWAQQRSATPTPFRGSSSPFDSLTADNLFGPFPLLIRVIGVAAFVPGIILFFVARNNRIKMEKDKTRQTELVEGTVTENGRTVTFTSRRSAMTFREAVVSYQFQGKTYTKAFRDYLSWKPKEGDPIMLRLNPDDPEDCIPVENGVHENNKTATAGKVLMILGVTLYIIGKVFTIIGNM